MRKQRPKNDLSGRNKIKIQIDGLQIKYVHEGVLWITEDSANVSAIVLFQKYLSYVA